MQAQSPGFEANDLGFETRVDSWDINLAMQYRDVEPDDITRMYLIDFLPNLEWNFDGDLVGFFEMTQVDKCLFAVCVLELLRWVTEGASV